MEIPYTALSATRYKGVIEEFISREGTEYGDVEYSLEDKIAQIKAQLETGEVRLTYDDESDSCNLVRVK